MPKRHTYLPTLILLLCGGAETLFASGIQFVTDPNTQFNLVNFTNPNDPFNDLQTGQPDADIIGNAMNGGFYSAFDGTYIYYRVRLGSTDSGNYAGLFWVGVDGNADGKLDVFIGVNNQGHNTLLQFVTPGTGANNSPSTTSIGNPLAQYQIVETGANFYYTSVNTTLQPGLTNTDLNADGRLDAFLTFRLPFYGVSGTATLQGAMLGIGGVTISASSPLGYVIATSTQANSLNQDIGGIDNKAMDPNLTWLVLGAMPVVNADGTSFAPSDPAAPEPAVILEIAGGLGLIALRCGWRRKKHAGE